jgi:hypothetical protein
MSQVKFFSLFLMRNLTSKSSGSDDDDDDDDTTVICWWCTALLRAMDSSFGLIQFDGFELNRIPVIAEFKQYLQMKSRMKSDC